MEYSEAQEIQHKYNQLTDEEKEIILALIEERLSDPKYKPYPLHQAG